MKERIYSAFAEITMPPDCEKQILEAVDQKKKQESHRRNFQRIAAAAACLMAVILFLSRPTMVEALENAISSALERFTVTAEDGTSTVRYESSDGKFHVEDVYDQDGKLTIGSGGNNISIAPEWYVEQNGRVYFAGNGEFIDVTDMISIQTPFTYSFTDSNGIIHYICIGGECDPDPELWNVGYAEWYYDPNYVDANGNVGNWIGGYADNHWDKETDDDWPWLKAAKQEMGIPWS